MKGFTLIELMLVLFFFAVLLVSSIAVVNSLQSDSELTKATHNILSVLRIAQSQTVASEDDTRYGVYFDDMTSPHQYVLFQGQFPLFGYATRIVANDEIHKLSKVLEFSTISFGLGKEIVFERIQGTADIAGNIVVRVKSDVSKTKTMYVETSGNIEIGNMAVPTDSDRVKDSRHVHVDFTGRDIDVSVATSETITLTFFSPSVTETIILSDFLSGGQIVWEEEVDVGGEMQKIKIHTHRLNDVGFISQFSIHRDRRFNTKAVDIEISGDLPDPNKIIQYNAAGVTTPGDSSHVSSPVQQ